MAWCGLVYKCIFFYCVCVVLDVSKDRRKNLTQMINSLFDNVSI